MSEEKPVFQISPEMFKTLTEFQEQVDEQNAKEAAGIENTEDLPKKAPEIKTERLGQD
ncbi:hypothetical protein H6F77_23545 [Microcoleus sp. FACHB-831]|uniref:hypothetical protein n=1 Tax=Microcoleus sp. FACHB-831 TaxID=2692827 RepID=UPI0016876EA9|nr:hypothetical protein [Microcoleus sp. FACHB-831]MBD1924020.1 hypothetical protein [Microcoleus sp. FACHB-831]